MAKDPSKLSCSTCSKVICTQKLQVQVEWNMNGKDKKVLADWKLRAVELSLEVHQRGVQMLPIMIAIT